MKELKSVVQNERKKSVKKSKLSLLRSRTFLLPALLISISFTIQVTNGVELCSYYVGFIFKDVGISLEMAGIINQVILSRLKGDKPCPAGHYYTWLPPHTPPPVQV